ncbi:MAG: hypothetical protein AAGG48_18085 [Planctomycetota bacterium]
MKNNPYRSPEPENKGNSNTEKAESASTLVVIGCAAIVYLVLVATLVGISQSVWDFVVSLF